MRGYKEWWPERVCNTEDATILFDTKPRKAKDDYCDHCPVKKDCLNYALLYKEHGVWGGTTKADRDQILEGVPQLYHLLKIEAIQAGILEVRYTIDQYWESMRAARKLAQENSPGQRYSQTALKSVPAPTLQEFEELLVEWNTL